VPGETEYSPSKMKIKLKNRVNPESLAMGGGGWKAARPMMFGSIVGVDVLIFHFPFGNFGCMSICKKHVGAL
jgi:hypothetical protein